MSVCDEEKAVNALPRTKLFDAISSGYNVDEEYESVTSLDPRSVGLLFSRRDWVNIEKFKGKIKNIPAYNINMTFVDDNVNMMALCIEKNQFRGIIASSILIYNAINCASYLVDHKYIFPEKVMIENTAAIKFTDNSNYMSIFNYLNGDQNSTMTNLICRSMLNDLQFDELLLCHETHLMVGCKQNNDELIKLLLERKPGEIYINRKNTSNKTALDYAQSQVSRKLLIDAGAK